ncbi:MAG: flagellar hook-length control protein FliK [Lachnospiraceae bacterium]|nr:flagellar hook-length control protein FliK [Lachnospiraceae bacterium]
MPISIDSSYANSDHGRISTYNGEGRTENVREGAVSQNDSLSAGNTITGEIIEKDGEQVMIRLSNDRTISAKLQGNADIEVGMRLTFEVAKGGSQTALRPLFANLSNSNAAMSALRAAGLPINDTTLTMTDRMMTESMPVNRNALAEMFRSVSAHSNVSPESIVQMTKLNMPLTESNVIQFDNYRNFEHQITNDLQNVSEGIADLFREAAGNAGDSQVFAGMSTGSVINEVLNLIDTDSLETIMPDQNAGISESALAGQSAETSVNANISLSAEEQMVLSNDIQNLLILAGEQSDIHEPLNPSEVITAVKNLVNEYPPDDIKVIEAELAAYSEEASEAMDEGKLQNSAMEDIAALKNPGREAGTVTDSGVPSASAETGSVRESLTSPDLQHAISHGSERVSENTTGSQNPAVPGVQTEDSPELAAAKLKHKITEKLSSILRSDGFSKLVKDSVKAQMSIKPEDVAKPGKIDELYDKIVRTSAKVSELMESIGRPDSAVANSAGALTDNVNFMNQLNEFLSYVQLPLKMAGEDANGELYVYTNRKSLSDSNGNFTALLHLDMEHLGPMDIYVSMRDYTKVSTNFYLQSEDMLDFIEAHIDELTKRLTDKGYNTSMKVTKKDPNEPILPIADEFTKDEANAQMPVVVSKMRFDVRA